ncbi:MAG: S9 family peptidase [Chlamydiales bacterium]|nr:S9 family peptidase [Chlamydiales bacterium]
MRPLNIDTLTHKALRFGQLCMDRGTLYWTESRPDEKGRSVLMTLEGEVLPKTTNIKSRVHEYGGGSYLVSGGNIIFTNDTDQRVYFNDQPITTKEQGRFADFCFDAKRACIYAVREVQSTNTLARIDLNGIVTDIATGADFYAEPRLSPDGSCIVWISWNHPNMPWDNTTLTQWDFSSPPKILAENASIQHPMWTLNNTLYYLTDQSGTWNFPSYPLPADLGYPPWLLNMKRYCFHQDKIAAIATTNATDTLYLIDLKDKTHTVIETLFTSFNEIVSDGVNLYTIASGPHDLPTLVSILPQTQIKTIRKSSDINLKSPSQPISINYGSAHMFFYPPSNKLYDLPPLIVSPHSGPTAHYAPTLNLTVEYWTSRGFAFAAVNYAGSSGFGKAYRNRLNGQWGILDAADCINARQYLKDQQLIDSTKCAIIGSSAGGFTALATITQTDAFAAAISLYGICDVKALCTCTHKFESHYNNTLIGTYSHSPIHHVDKIRTPVLLIHGSEDKIVPPSQSEALYSALKARSIPCEYKLIEGEGHGFRSADAIKTSFLTQESYLKSVLELK